MTLREAVIAYLAMHDDKERPAHLWMNDLAHLRSRMREALATEPKGGKIMTLKEASSNLTSAINAYMKCDMDDIDFAENGRKLHDAIVEVEKILAAEPQPVCALTVEVKSWGKNKDRFTYLHEATIAPPIPNGTYRAVLYREADHANP